MKIDRIITGLLSNYDALYDEDSKNDYMDDEKFVYKDYDDIDEAYTPDCYDIICNMLELDYNENYDFGENDYD